MKMHREVLDQEALPWPGRKFQLVQLLRLDIDHLMANTAHQVMVTSDLAVEPHGRSRVMNSSQHAELAERVQHAIDRGPRESGNTPPHGLVYLIDAGMIISLQHGPQNITALDRQRQALRTAQALELLQSSLNLAFVHDLGSFTAACSPDDDRHTMVKW